MADPPAPQWPSSDDGQGLPAIKWMNTKFAKLPVYNMRYGDPSQTQPYLIRATIPEGYKWCPIGGIDPADSRKFMDGYIKAHLYHLHRNPPAGLDDAQKRKAAIILGVTRASMTATYLLVPENIVAEEMAPTYLNVIQRDDGTITYTPCAPPDAPPADAEAGAAVIDYRRLLIDGLNLTPEELEVVGALVKVGATIPPLQGHNLMADGHHYLNISGSSGQRAFAAVERQVLANADLRSWFEFSEFDSRNILCHKAGHPISIAIKKACATSTTVAARLLAMDLGSAASRLPALESDVKPVSAYLKLSNVYKSVLAESGYHDVVENSLLVEMMDGLRQFPIGANASYDENNVQISVVIGSKWPESRRVVATNRTMVLDAIRAHLPRLGETAAMCYGFYRGLLESTSAYGERAGDGEDLSKVRSLIKLKHEHPGAFYKGLESYRDYRAMQNHRRQQGEFQPLLLDFC